MTLLPDVLQAKLVSSYFVGKSSLLSQSLNPKLRIFIMTAFEIQKSEFEKVFPTIKIAGLIEKPVSIHRLLKTIEA
jgi:hypothetical protein